MKIEPITEIEYRVGVTNSIKDKYPKYRKNSKTITFALQYLGTYRTLMSSGGFPEDEAKSIEANYHAAHVVSKRWLDKIIKQASIDGYVTGAFGLKIRTPLLKQTVLGSSKILSAAKAEARTAGNAVQQSWCLLNNRAQSEFLEILRNSKYATRIRPCALIHDALYFIADNEPSVITWLNKTIVDCIRWNNHPAIYHPEVGLEGNLSLFVPDWNNEITIPNDITEDSLLNLVQKYEENNG